MSTTFAVVCFTEDNSVSVVPTSWLDNDEAYWPPYDVQKRIDKAVKEAEKPKENWKTYHVRILGVTGIYNLLVIITKSGYSFRLDIFWMISFIILDNYSFVKNIIFQEKTCSIFI